MIGIIASGILLLITIILRITLGTLTDKFEVLEEWLSVFNWLIAIFAVICVIFVIVVLIKVIKK